MGEYRVDCGIQDSMKQCGSEWVNAGLSGLGEYKVLLRGRYRVSGSNENAFLWPWLSGCISATKNAFL